MASLLLVLLASVSCRLTGPFRSWQTEAERLRGPQVEAEPVAAAAAAKDTDARGRPRPVSIRERLEKDGWRLTEKLLTDMLEDMMDIWKSNMREGGAVTMETDHKRQRPQPPPSCRLRPFAF